MDVTRLRATVPVVSVLAVLALAACVPGTRRDGSGSTTSPATSTPTTQTATGTAEPTATPAAWPEVRLERRWTGFDQPLDLKAVPGSDALAVVEKPGRVRLVRGGKVASGAFLDLSNKVSAGSERGLLGIAFPLSYPASGRFYVYYTARNGDVTISRFRSRPGADTADAGSEQVVLTIGHRQFSNHNGGGMLFGPDGFLYLGVGDGGSGGDPNGNGQNTGVLLAKLLRISVESTGGAPQPSRYDIPADNPFAGRKGARPEIWAYGLRNPWRFSFDRANGDLYIADVGQGAWEEIDWRPGGDRGGQDYGWNLFEGTHPYPPSATRKPSSRFTMPVAEYGHDAGASVTGGYVYRGSRWPALVGTYYYADFESGKLWGLRRRGQRWESRTLAETGLGVSSFGEDANGEVYVLDLNGGAVYELTGR